MAKLYPRHRFNDTNFARFAHGFTTYKKSLGYVSSIANVSFTVLVFAATYGATGEKHSEVDSDDFAGNTDIVPVFRAL